MLYFTTSHSTANYTERPTGELALERLLESKRDCWIAADSKVIKEKRHLVFADWRAAHFTNSKRFIVEAALTRLLDEGFSIDVLHEDGSVSPLQLSVMQYNLDYLLKQSPAKCLKQAQQATQKPVDQILILDDYRIELLLDDNRIEQLLKDRLDTSQYPRTLNLTDLCNSLCYGNIVSIPSEKIFDAIKWSKQAQPQLSAIECDEYSLASTRLLKRLQQQGENLNLYYKHLDVARDKLASIMQNKAITLNGFKFSLADFNKINSVVIPINYPLTDNSLTAIIEFAPKLEKINLTSCLYISPDLILKEGSLNLLNEIDLFRTTISETTLTSFLKASPNIKRINLRGFENITSGFLLEAESLNQLEVIDLGFSTISMKNLQVLLESAPNLKDINLIKCKNISDELTLEKASLNRLEKICLVGSLISSKNLQTLLEAAPKLKKINLLDCENISTKLILADNSLNHLEDICLSGSTISTESLQALLKSAPNLKKIYLKNCKNISGKLTLAAKSLNQLEEIDLECSTITSRSLQALLEAAPRLKEINLIRFSNISGVLTLEKGSLPYLNKINLNDSAVNEVSLKAMLEAASSLKEVNLKRCKNISSEFFIKKIALGEVEKINLKCSSIEVLGLQVLLESAPNLKKLNLKYCAHISGKLNLKQGCANSLEEILLLDSTINSISLKSLLQASPNLKKIDLRHCENILDGITLKKVILNQLEEIDLSCSNICAVSLQAFLEAAPNLKKIKLNHCRNILDVLMLKEARLNQLEEVDLSFLSIHSASLKSLLESAPNIKKISLYRCRNISDVLTLKKAALNQLEEIDVSYSNIDLKSLQALLEISPNIKKIKLHACINVSDVLILKKATLKQLEEIDVSYSNIELTSLQAFFEAAPNIKKIKLANCRNMIGKLTLVKGSLNCLTEIDFYGTKISYQNLTTLLDAAPNLILQLSKNTAVELMYANENRKNLEEIDKQLDQLESKFLTSSGTNSRALSDVPSSALKPSAVPTSSVALSPVAASTSSAVQPRVSFHQYIDADTRLGEHKFYCTRTFFTTNPNDSLPHVSRYRTNLYQGLLITDKPRSINEAFSIVKLGDKCLIKPRDLINSHSDVFTLAGAVMKKPSDKCYYGKQTVHLEANRWHSLDSLSADEVMTHWHYTARRPDLTIRYSQRDNQYYIRSKTKQLVTVDWLIKIAQKAVTTLPTDIQALIKQYNNFGEGRLMLKTTRLTGKAYLKAIQTQQKGACRHRAIAFKAQMQKKYPDINTRIVMNDCHAFVEIYVNGNWYACQLGGHPGQLNIDNSHCPEVANSEDGSEQFSTALVESQQRIERYKTQFTTWQIKHAAISGVNDYCRALLNSDDGNKKLITFNSSHTLLGLQATLWQHAQATSRPIFYVQSPDDLICSAPYTVHTAEGGMTKKGPGGPLYDFLQLNKNNNSILLINYANFEPNDVVRFLALVDETRQADGVDLPDDILIIGLQDIRAANCYQCADFYSNFDSKEHCVIAESTLGAKAQVLVVKTLNPGEPEVNVDVTINLFNASNWKQRLFGAWEINEDKLVFKEGLLIPHLATENLTVEIQNGRWHSLAFQQFWQQAKLGSFIYQGRTVKLPKGFKLIRSEGYDWQILKDAIELPITESCDDSHSDRFILNPSQLSHLMGRYVLVNAKQIKKQAGWLAKVATTTTKTLPVYLTANLSDDSWAQIFDECNRLNVKLNVRLAPGVTLPDALQAYKSVAVPECKYPDYLTAVTDSDGQFQPGIVFSSDIDATLAQICQTQDNAVIIDVSELSGADLLDSLDGSFDQEHLKFSFKNKQGALIKALNQGKSVILKGYFSNELIDELMPLLWKNSRIDAKQALVIIADKAQQPLFSAVTQRVFNDEPTAACKKALLTTEFGDDTVAKLNSFDMPLCQLKAQARYKQAFADKAPSNAWHGLAQLPHRNVVMAPLVPELSADKAQAFTQARVEKVTSMLAHSPYVFIAGLTGVGKSTFVESELKGDNDSLHLGEAHILAWLESKPGVDGSAYLFIDEANLSPSQWSMFEGLFHTPQAILYHGRYYPLTPQHKVIFAGNPVNYGDERKLAPFFMRHGNTVVFEPLCSELIYEKILKPIFDGTSIPEAEQLTCCQTILEAYQLICRYSSTEVLISPRELQAMAITLCCEFEAKQSTVHADDYFDQFTRATIYQVAKPVIPQANLAQFAQYLAISPTKFTVDDSPILAGDYYVTPSRRPLKRQLEQLIQQRAWRTQPMRNQAQQYGGLGGIIIEGEPGIGKSELVIKTLLNHGYQEKKPQSTQVRDKSFYRMPVSMAIKQKKELLLKAFNEGAVVIVDEINASPMMEQFLNALLMGKTPDGLRPDKPGFMLIGTQNPISMVGRKQSSQALKRRLLHAHLPPYSINEIQYILDQKGLPQQCAQEMAIAYCEQVDYANLHDLTPPPCFRDLLKAASTITRSSQNTITELPSLAEHSATFFSRGMQRFKSTIRDFFTPSRTH